MKILILSANGGIGNAIVGECLRRFPEATIIGTYRRSYSEVTHQNILWFRKVRNKLTDILASQSELDTLFNPTL